MPVSFVWFDIGYTLLYMRREETYRQALEEQGIQVSQEELERAFHLTDKLFMREYPGMFGKDRPAVVPWYLGVLNYRLGHRLDVCATAASWLRFQSRTNPYWVPFPGVRETLQELRRRALRMGIISNWDSSARSLLELHGLAEFFDPIVVSSEVGHEKPGREIFELALGQAAVAPIECLYVGDNYYDDAVGAGKVGIRTLLVNRYGRLGIEELAEVPVIRSVRELPACLPAP